MAYVRDMMNKNIAVAKTNDSIKRISRILRERNISNMPVVNSAGELVGIVSEQDIIRAMESEDFMKMTAKDIMTTSVLSVKENDHVEYVSKIFVERPYRSLPVTKNKKVIGIITREDIISNFMSDYY